MSMNDRGEIGQHEDNATPFEKFPFYRPFQMDVIRDVLASDKKVTIVEAPPGTGKSIIGMSLAYQTKGQSLYLCTTKPLQFQLSHDFPDVPLLMGRSNYPCLLTDGTEAAFPELTCEDCALDGQEPKEGAGRAQFECKGRCTYQGWKKRCLGAPVCILNTSYYLTETAYVGKFLGRNLVIVDECDRLEDAITSFVEVKVSEFILKKLGLQPPQYVTKWESWKTWTAPFCRAVRAAYETIPESTQNAKKMKERQQLKSLYQKGIILQTLLDDSWIYDTQAGKWGITHSFKPIWIGRLAEQYFWSTADRFVLMSGTIGGPTGAQEMARTLGLDNGQWDYIAVPNQFPAERRPVYYRPTANLTRKTVEAERPLILPAITKIMEEYPNGKGLIHTVSYSLCSFIVNRLDRVRLRTHGTGSERQEALTAFKASPDPLVLVSPSMDRGIDLPYDACRFLIIVKIPYPDLSSKQTNKRLYGSKYGQKWYAWMTAQSIIQMSMRGMRSADDQCDIYILDKQFGDFFARHQNLFPIWWQNALRWPEQKLEWAD